MSVNVYRYGEKRQVTPSFQYKSITKWQVLPGCHSGNVRVLSVWTQIALHFVHLLAISGDSFYDDLPHCPARLGDTCRHYVT